MIKTEITVNDRSTGATLSIEVRLWRDAGHGVAALTPRDDPSRQLMIDHRDFLKAAIREKYGLDELVCYESQFNGLYTPGHNSMLRNGASLKESELVRIASGMESQGWKRSQDLSQHRLPPSPEI